MTARGIPILLGFFLLWVVLDRSASELGSTMGEGGAIVCALVIVTAVALEWFVFKRSLRGAVTAIGLRAGRRNVVGWAAAGCAVMLLYYPAFALLTGTPVGLRADWSALLPGLFLQAGIAEEVVFRGFLFHHLRGQWPFWRAATLTAIPFVAVHLLLFATLDFGVALASVLLSLVLLFPLSWLFEVSRGSILAPALVHFVVQGSIKVVEVPSESLASLAVGWMAVSAVVPWVFFRLGPRPLQDVA
jgi:membrane protease YdiL (CAAX protease family)